MPKEPTTLTTFDNLGVQPGMIITISGRAHRVVSVRSRTELVIDRPWWMPLSSAWWFVWSLIWDTVLGRARTRLWWFWFRLRHGWDED